MMTELVSITGMSLDFQEGLLQDSRLKIDECFIRTVSFDSKD